MDNGDGRITAGMGMGICLIDVTVGRPAGMTDAEFSTKVFTHRAFEFNDTAGTADGVQGTIAQGSETGGVISPVFETFQSVEHHISGAIPSNITNNSA